jgi:hypothetical protein
MAPTRLSSSFFNYRSLVLKNRYYQEISNIKYYLKVIMMEMPREPVNIVYEMYNECETPSFREGQTLGNKPDRNPAKRDGDFGS